MTMSTIITQQIDMPPEIETPPATPTLEKELPHMETNGTPVMSTDINQAQQVVEEILRINNELASLPDLKPCSRVNNLFGQLVVLCIKPWNRKVAKAVLGDRRITATITNLRQMCAEGEGELERYWAQTFLQKLLIDANSETDKPIHKPDPNIILKSFPYYQNYIDLCNLELSTLLAVSSRQSELTPLSMAFVGSGPLPFTSFLFAKQLPSLRVTNIDIDASAIFISSQLATALDYSNMHFLHEDASNLSCLSGFDVVFLAALVGMSFPEKIQILRSISKRMREGSFLCVRSAVGLRGLLYPVIEYGDEIAGCGLEMVVEVRPWNHIVNSTLVMKVVR